jgi:hypothetical protein
MHATESAITFWRRWCPTKGDHPKGKTLTFFDKLAAWTETDWLACVRPHNLLYFLGDKATDRKLRLFGCACVRQFWHKLKEQSPKRKASKLRNASPTVWRTERTAADQQKTRRDVLGAETELGNVYRSRVGLTAQPRHSSGFAVPARPQT